MTQRQRTINILRYSFGVTIAMAIAQGSSSFLSYILPVLLIGFLKPPAQTIRLKNALRFTLLVSLACLAGLAVSKTVYYPIVYLLIEFLILLFLFYAKEEMLSPAVRTWLLIAITVIPLTSISSYNISLLISDALVQNALITAVVSILLFVFFPNPDTKQIEEKKEIKHSLSKEHRFNQALVSSLVVFPLLVVFNVFQLNGGILILVYVALLSSTPEFAKDFKVGKFLILGNVIGGIVALIYYNIMTLIPEFFFLLLLTFLISLVFASYIMSEKPIGKLLSTAFSTVLVVCGSVFSSDSEAGDEVWVRVIQVMIAVLYVVLAFGFITKWQEKLKNQKQAKLSIKTQHH